MPAAPRPNSTLTPAEEQPSLRARVVVRAGRAWAGLSHNRLLTVVLLSGLCIIATSCVSIGWYFLQHRETRAAEPLLEQALAALDGGHYDDARRLIGQLSSTTDLAPTEQGPSLFVMGTVVAHEAALLRSHTAESRALYLVAARYLEEARDRGFPRSHEVQGLTLLGKCLFHSGHYAESLPAMQEAAQAEPHDRWELYGLLATAYLRDTPPNLKAALQYSRRALESAALTPQQREDALLQQAQILLRMGDPQGCRHCLSSISSESPLHDLVLLLEGQCLMWEGEQILAQDHATSDAGRATAPEKFRQAMTVLEQAQRQSQDRTGVRVRQAQYLLGVCHRRLGDIPAALQAFIRLSRQDYGTDEALVAELNEAEIHLAQGDYETARTLYTKVIQEAGDAATYANPWVELSDFRTRLHIAQQQFQQANQFAAALAMSEACQKILPADERTEIEAQAHKDWAEFLLRGETASGRASGGTMEAEARGHFRSAADAYQRLTTLRYSKKSYTDDLWKSGECFLRGQNYEAAIPLFRQFLQHAPRPLHPQGLVGLGECHLALGHFHEALRALTQCIQFHPKHPESYQARLLASQACQQLNKLPEAKQLLMDNLQNSELTPRSVQWQHSLFACGMLLFHEGMKQELLSRAQGVDSTDLARRKEGLTFLYAASQEFQEAIRYMEEAIQRYPDAPETSTTTYCIAEAYRHLAKLPDKSQVVEPTESRRTELMEQRREFLESAAGVYARLQTRLLEKQRQHELSAVEKAILRNSCFAHADILFYLEDYEQAIKAYLAATNRYQHDPQALEAFLQMASCYRRLNAPAEARGTLLQAQAFLVRLKADTDFEQTTRFNREDWDALLGWLAQL
ncbi:MAG: tetratricopeptide repeat protein [Pirellulaceae bacterium]